jgi:hypothetical protein
LTDLVDGIGIGWPGASKQRCHEAHVLVTKLVK